MTLLLIQRQRDLPLHDALRFLFFDRSPAEKVHARLELARKPQRRLQGSVIHPETRKFIRARL